jgi:Rps23 Pro-64 3,4-dihydroxylase Tpa1-like proline 4-hydroxylase
MLDDTVNLSYNFIDKEICNSVTDWMIKNENHFLKSPQVNTKHMPIQHIKDIDQVMYNYIIENIYNKIKNKIELNYNFKFLEHAFYLQIWDDGAYHNPHNDLYDNMNMSAVIYLNNDFNGGILSFVRKNINISPKTGLLTFFNGRDELNIHTVHQVSNGKRCTVGSFWYQDETVV